MKSAVLLAGLHASGVTRVHEHIATRDHTERALRTFGIDVARTPDSVAVTGGQRLTGRPLDVPGDISSAAFWMAAAASLSGSEIVITHVGLNPTRSGILDVLRRLGAEVVVEEDGAASGEPIGSIIVRHRGLGSAVVTPAEVPGVIDELPVLAALATHGGELLVTGAAELRVKESDRLAVMADGLTRLGVPNELAPDGIRIEGGHRLRGGEIESHGDHRIAMAFTIASLLAEGPIVARDTENVATSFPGFVATARGCGLDVSVE